MRNEKGFSEPCFQPLSEAARAVGVGLAVTFPPGAEPRLDEDFLKMNPQLKREYDNGGFKIYHPSVATQSAEGMSILFEAWVDWSQAHQAKIVLRKEGDREVLCGRLREAKPFPFDRPKESFPKYVELDVFTRRNDGVPSIDYAKFFEPVFLRFELGGRQFAYFRIAAKLDCGVPMVTVNRADWRDVPRHLLPR